MSGMERLDQYALEALEPILKKFRSTYIKGFEEKMGKVPEEMIHQWEMETRAHVKKVGYLGVITEYIINNSDQIAQKIK